jgi:hypothetical protein
MTTLMSVDERGCTFFIWQGYHHRWEYNHRLNRFGSYVSYPEDQSNGPEAVVGHTAASGTGADVAHFSEFVTGVQAEGVAVQPGQGETLVECLRGATTPFRMKIELDLEPELAGKDNFTVIINGFDLYADAHSAKIVSFDLEITDPTLYAKGAKLRFNILGSLCFDCRSPECQLWPFRLEVEDLNRQGTRPEKAETAPPTPPRKRGIPRRRVEKAANWLKRQLVTITNLDEVKRSVIGEDQDSPRRRLFRIVNKRFYLRLFKLRLPTPYVLRVHYLIIAGDADALQVTESDMFENSYAWDLENEIHQEELGIQSIEVEGDNPQGYQANILAFKHVSLELTLDEKLGTSNPVQWGKGIHFLEWSVAVRDTQIANGRVTAKLDMFYKCWSEAMNELITITTWGAFRAAGRARHAARLSLLQFKHASASQPLEMAGQIHWPGRGLSAKQHPRAYFERPIALDR